MRESSPAHVSQGDAAYWRLRDDITGCRLSPGARITKRALAESTGFGVSAIRDALTRLDHEGLVRTLPRKGYQVAPLTMKSVDALFAMWRIVGLEITRIAVSEANDVDRRRVAGVFVAMSQESGGADRVEMAPIRFSPSSL